MSQAAAQRSGQGHGLAHPKQGRPAFWPHPGPERARVQASRQVELPHAADLAKGHLELHLLLQENEVYKHTCVLAAHCWSSGCAVEHVRKDGLERELFGHQ